jgi:hypothetical protein
MTWRFAVVVLAACAASSSSSAQAAFRAPARSEIVERNPKRLDAVQLLVQPVSNNSQRVRFEWDQVPGATQYVLSGKWTSVPSWTIHSGEYRVTQKVATSWDDEKVRFEVTLPAGNHSWEVVALFRSVSSGDFEHPTLRSFEIK